MARNGHGVGEEVLVAERAEPAEDVFCLEHLDARAERHRERELVDVERERRLAARVEEAIDVPAHRARQLLAEELDDGVDVARLDVTDDGILEPEAELVEEPLQARRHLGGGLDRLFTSVGDRVEPFAEVRCDGARRAVAPLDDRQLALVTDRGDQALAAALVEAHDVLEALAERRVALGFLAAERDDSFGLRLHLVGEKESLRLADAARHTHRGDVARRQLGSEELGLRRELLHAHRLAEAVLVARLHEDGPDALERGERHARRIDVAARPEAARDALLERRLPHPSCSLSRLP